MPDIGRREFIGILGGTAAVFPHIALAQRPTVPIIGYFNLGSESVSWGALARFRQGLADAGLVEGRNVAIEARWANLQYEKLREMATELVRREVAVIVAHGGAPVVLAARAATSTIPIVMLSGMDPVGYGLVVSLNRPGSNVTGITSLTGELAGKRLDLLCQMVPEAKTIGYLMANGAEDPRYGETSNLAAVARALGRELVAIKAIPGHERTIETAFDDLVKMRAQALMVGAHSALDEYGDKIVALTALHKIPASYPFFYSVLAGGFMSYGVARDVLRQVAIQYVAPILRGAAAADLPVQQPTKFELTINLKTAKALGLEIPPILLAQADEVLE
jgi:putative ABC transport system substrate-binding protein